MQYLRHVPMVAFGQLLITEDPEGGHSHVNRPELNLHVIDELAVGVGVVCIELNRVHGCGPGVLHRRDRICDGAGTGREEDTVAGGQALSDRDADLTAATENEDVLHVSRRT
ncbi:hypothetical protein GCM10009702_03980 [Propioniferax innocua]